MSKSGSEVLKQEDVVLAVLIADSFSIRFAPVTDSKPKVKILQLDFLTLRTHITV
jgi:hypothetical protein